MRRSASQATITPPPSSIAPVPTSHESLWPPITTTSSGRSEPVISATALRDGASGSVRASILSWTTTRWPRCCMRCSIAASSMEMAANGIGLAVES